MNRLKINDRIAAHLIRLISADGQNRGEMLKSAALEIAKKEGLDLVEVSSGKIPVCKIMNHGKIVYEQKKSEKQKNHAPSVKEIKFRYNTEDHDLNIKIKKTQELLSDGHRVIFSMMVQGREKYIAGNAAKEKFISTVKKAFHEYKLSEVKDSSNSYSVTISPCRATNQDENDRTKTGPNWRI